MTDRLMLGSVHFLNANSRLRVPQCGLSDTKSILRPLESPCRVWNQAGRSSPDSPDPPLLIPLTYDTSHVKSGQDRSDTGVHPTKPHKGDNV